MIETEDSSETYWNTIWVFVLDTPGLSLPLLCETQEGFKEMGISRKNLRTFPSVRSLLKLVGAGPVNTICTDAQVCQVKGLKRWTTNDNSSEAEIRSYTAILQSKGFDEHAQKRCMNYVWRDNAGDNALYLCDKGFDITRVSGN